VASNGTPILPGKLGNPDLTIQDDPRVDPRLAAVMEMADEMPPPPVDGYSPVEDIVEFIGLSEAGSVEHLAMSVAGLPPIKGVESSVERIQGVDGNEILLFIHRPTEATGPLPGVLHLHGGGMVMLDAEGPLYTRWRDELAGRDLVVIGVEFRNAAGRLGPHPFPAGLNDCTSALQWVDDNKAALGISKLIVSGDSGGGNLTLATTIKAKREGRIEQIDGVYALCPYISGAYREKRAELTSLYENDGLFVDCVTMSYMARAYDPDRENVTNPLAWPYHAETADLEGLPPHVISVNELDPLRDEGLGYFRKLRRAGTPATSRTVNGTCHAAENNFMSVLPDVCQATLRDIAGFAYSL
jgi:acetyl esterase/lipase